MNAKRWMMVAAMAAVAWVTAGPAWAQGAPPAEGPEAGEGGSCDFCAAKTSVNELVPWVNWGFDVRARQEYFKNIGLDDDAANNETLRTRVRPRLWAQIRPLDDIDLAINARLVWEYFLICKPDSADSVPRTEVLFDDLNVRWAHIGDSPLSLTVGRQQLRFGDGWLVFEGTPMDGSRTIFFDAIRGTYEAEEMNTVFDLVYIHNKADSGDGLVRPFNHDDVDGHISEFDESGLILYAQNKSMENTQVDGYFIYYHADGDPGNPFVPGQDEDDTLADIYTLGARLAQDINENLQGRVEAAFQFGDVDGESLCGAMGLNSRLTYRTHDEYDTSAWAGYEYRSGGKDPGENFAMPWARYPQWSEVYTGAVDTLDGRPGVSANLHRPYVGFGFQPTKPLVFQANYHALFVDNNNVTAAGISDSGCFRGHLVTALLKYEFREHISGHLQGEMFCPGNYYTEDRNDPAFFARYEVVFTW